MAKELLFPSQSQVLLGLNRLLYEVKNGTISLSGNVILSHFFFRIVDKEKIGIVGRNGAGKTTLLKLMAGEIELDYNDDNTIGEIVKSKDYTVGYLKQQLAGEEEINSSFGVKDRIVTAYDYLLSAFNKLIELEHKIDEVTKELSTKPDEKKGILLNSLIDTYNYEGGETYIKELKTGFKKFGFDELDLNRQINTFSGGQTTKISLLKMLLSKPDILILDEPTNHLDIDAIEWMEDYLISYKKNVVIVSHDRMFLDNICNVIYDIEDKNVTRYTGNYTDFVEQKKINYELKLAEYNKNVKEIERLTRIADRFRYKATKAKMVQSKDKVIEKLANKTVKPQESDMKTFHAKIVPNKTGGKVVLRCDNLEVGYDRPLANVNFTINRGDRLAIIGANGTGKSTFIKTIVGIIEKYAGSYEYGHEIEYEYFDQRIAENNSTKTVFDDFSDEFPTYSNVDVRNRLGRFLFGEEDVDKKVKDLSGGEKVRLTLSKIFEKKPNLLILDEPTNHLDILGKESLEEIIENFEGTVIFVSHDRYFVRKISNKILFFDKYAIETKFFEFGYEDYENYIKNNYSDNNALNNTNSVSLSVNFDKPVSDDTSTKEGKNYYETNKQQKKDKRKKDNIENEILKIENEIKKIEEEILDETIQTDFEKLNEKQKKIDELNVILEEKYNEWEKL